ncbi:uncharacterized protein IUM83_05454 [Phytophthora cinnamomi]|uniref:uncharacterized protein n=1 Tax=Phytophthora cinnamomi TaxID=4785 RepID=UPI003559E5E1|nr:hypothetical protein IUM83_05454 [Phytophthora cinnamomi]
MPLTNAQLRAEIDRLTQAMADRSKVPSHLPKFTGKRGEDVREWLFHVENACRINGVAIEDASTRLPGIAGSAMEKPASGWFLHWSSTTRNEEHTWGVFCEHVLHHFEALNYQSVLRERLQRLKQTADIETHNGDYSALIFLVEGMSVLDQVLNYARRAQSPDAQLRQAREPRDAERRHGSGGQVRGNPLRGRGAKNGIADALSRRPDLQPDTKFFHDLSVTSFDDTSFQLEMTEVTTDGDLVKDIKAEYAKDREIRAILAAINDRAESEKHRKFKQQRKKYRHYIEAKDLLWYQSPVDDAPPLVVPNSLKLRQRIIGECHESNYGGHPGAERATASESGLCFLDAVRMALAYLGRPSLVTLEMWDDFEEHHTRSMEYGVRRGDAVAFYEYLQGLDIPLDYDLLFRKRIKGSIPDINHFKKFVQTLPLGVYVTCAGDDILQHCIVIVISSPTEIQVLDGYDEAKSPPYTVQEFMDQEWIDSVRFMHLLSLAPQATSRHGKRPNRSEKNASKRLKLEL